jgi:hypothetical protein
MNRTFEALAVVLLVLATLHWLKAQLRPTERASPRADLSCEMNPRALDTVE